MNNKQKNLILCLIISVLIMAGACNDKVVCPAFESYYMHDLDAREQYFSYFGEDSLPRTDLPVARRNKNGLGKQSRFFAFRTKEASLRTIPMEDVMPPDPDELEADSITPVDQQMIDELEADSTLVASADTIPQLRERPTGPGGRPMRINNDQHYYESRFYEQLANPVPPPVPMNKLPRSMRNDLKKKQKKAKKEKKEKGGGLFGGLFGKKNNAAADSLATPEVPIDETPKLERFEEDEETEGEDDDEFLP